LLPASPGLLLSHLPAIYHSSEELRILLSIFEELLFGSESGEEAPRGPAAEPAPEAGASGDESGGSVQPAVARTRALAEEIAAIPLLLDPYAAPREFLPWLAQWVAVSDLSGLSVDKQRRLIAKIVPLYSRRGTRGYLEELLAFYAPEGAVVAIDEDGVSGFTVGDATVGLDTRLGGEQAFWFRVSVTLPHPPHGEEQARLEQQLRRVIDLAKPAHTMYQLELG
jgi:phage tail-like protein